MSALKMVINIADTDLIRKISTMQIEDMNTLFMTFAPENSLAMTVKNVRCTNICSKPIFKRKK